MRLSYIFPRFVLALALTGGGFFGANAETRGGQSPRTRISQRLERMETRLDILSSQLIRVQRLLDLQQLDRDQAQRSTDCSAKCFNTHGTWHESESKEQGDARRKCFDECTERYPMPAIFGGGC